MNEFCKRLLIAIEIDIQFLDTIGVDRIMGKEWWDQTVDQYWDRRQTFEAILDPLPSLPSGD